MTIENNDIKRNERSEIEEENSERDMSCCCVVDSCGCSVDPCGCSVDPCGCSVDPCGCYVETCCC